MAPRQGAGAGRGLTLVAGPMESHGRRGLAKCSGEAAESQAPAGSVELAFQPGYGRNTSPALISQILLCQAALVTQPPQQVTVEYKVCGEVGLAHGVPDRARPMS